MKTERELFEELQNKLVLKRLVFAESLNMYLIKDEYLDDDMTIQYCLEINHGWKMWQASASRGGYKLVPLEPSEEMIEAGCRAYMDCGVTQVYKAMVGVFHED